MDILQKHLDTADSLSLSDMKPAEFGICPVTLPDVAMVTREPENAMMMRAVAVFAHLMEGAKCGYVHVLCFLLSSSQIIKSMFKGVCSA